MAAPKNLRRTYLIDRGFQLKYTGLLALVGAVVPSLFGGFLFWIQRDWRLRLEATMTGQSLLKESLLQNEQTLLWLTGAGIIGLSVVLGLLGVLITHRVAGPLFVMNMYFKQLEQGRYPVARPLRKGDELKGLFEHFQSVLQTLREREKQEAERLAEALSQLPDSAGPAKELLKSMRDKKLASTA